MILECLRSCWAVSTTCGFFRVISSASLCRWFFVWIQSSAISSLGRATKCFFVQLANWQMVTTSVRQLIAYKVANKLVYLLEENNKAALQSWIRDSDYPTFSVCKLDSDVTDFSIKASHIIRSNLIQCTVNGSVEIPFDFNSRISSILRTILTC